MSTPFNPTTFVSAGSDTSCSQDNLHSSPSTKSFQNGSDPSGGSPSGGSIPSDTSTFLDAITVVSADSDASCFPSVWSSQYETLTSPSSCRDRHGLDHPPPRPNTPIPHSRTPIVFEGLNIPLDPNTGDSSILSTTGLDNGRDTTEWMLEPFDEGDHHTQSLKTRKLTLPVEQLISSRTSKPLTLSSEFYGDNFGRETYPNMAQHRPEINDETRTQECQAETCTEVTASSPSIPSFLWTPTHHSQAKGDGALDTTSADNTQKTDLRPTGTNELKMVDHRGDPFMTWEYRSMDGTISPQECAELIAFLKSLPTFTWPSTPSHPQAEGDGTLDTTSTDITQDTNPGSAGTDELAMVHDLGIPECQI